MSNQNHQPISIGNWLVSLLLLAIPIVGIVMLFVWAFSSGTNPSKSNWAKANLIFAAIAFLIFIVFSGLVGLAFVGYSNYADKGYGAEAEIYLKDVSNAVTLYEDIHGGQQPTLDDLKQEGILKPTPALDRNWKIEFSGNIFTATSSAEMPGGGGHATIYNRETGDFSGYGFEEDTGK